MKASWAPAGFFLTFSVILPPAAVASSAPQIEPQLVRLSYVQGDVRFNQGRGKHPDLKEPWEQAEANLPIGQGFALATGKGRAEIEFENGGMVYLAENSLLLFKHLDWKDGVPETRLELVSGTLTTAVAPLPEEIIAIDLSGGLFQIKYPMTIFYRIDSYLNGMAFTPQADGGSDFYTSDGAKIHLKKGQTAVLEGAWPIRIDEPEWQSETLNNWDQWVSTRYQARSAVMKAALKASGLPAPVPGLTEMYASGTFSPCPPYGTCWEPSRQSAGPPQTTQQPLPGGPASSQQPFTPQTVTFSHLESECLFAEWITRGVLARTPEEFAELSKEARSQPIEPWDSTLCYRAAWIYRNSRYYAVIIGKRHQHPVRWVKAGNEIAFVPRHPNDQQGKMPKNLKHGMFAVTTKDVGEQVNRLGFDAKARVELLSSPPKKLGDTSYPEVAKAEPPEIRAHLMGDEATMTYEYKTGRFLESGGEVAGKVDRPIADASLDSRGNFTGPGVVYGWPSSDATHQGNTASFSEGRRSSGNRSGGSGGGSAPRGGGSGGSNGGGSTSHGGGGGGYSGGSGGGSTSHSGGGSSSGGGASFSAGSAGGSGGGGRAK